MNKRKIIRTAMLQDYTGYPENLFTLIEEVAQKGYQSVSLTVLDEDMGIIKSLCDKAASFGLSVCLFTAYMKYQYKYLTEHPEQKLVSASDFKDQDGLSTSNWGCPFNPEFKKRYLYFLQEIALYPGVTRIQVNDEAYIPGTACYCLTCRTEYRQEFHEDMPLIIEPQIADWENFKWRRLIKWSIDRWNNVHGEMRKAIHSVNENIKVLFQASPANDLWQNPWSTSVDLAGMAEHLDGLCTDPYYTFHRAPFFTPPETYLSEWCRFLRGIVGSDKLVEIIPQGFSHPTFTRPLGEEDGIWSAIIPPSCGVDIITPYTYTLQRSSPVQKTYEKCFKLDKYIEKTVPLRYSALVHGAKTEIYKRPLPETTPKSFDGTRILPVAQSLRHGGIPYEYLPDTGLKNKKNLDLFKVVILPEVNCLSEDEEKGIREFAGNKGRLVVLGALGICDETGGGKKDDLLVELCGIRIIKENGMQQRFRMLEELPIMSKLFTVDREIAERYGRGVYEPLFTLSHCVDAIVPEDSKIIAEFVDEDGNPTGNPAIVLAGKDKNILWFAGFPTQNSVNKKYGISPRNQAHLLFPLLVEWHAGQKPALRVEGWPPEVPMRNLRPLDPRYMSTFEFFPMIGENVYIGVVTSYFKEPALFPMIVDIPDDMELMEVKELLSDEKIPFRIAGSIGQIDVDMGYDDAAKVYLFTIAQLQKKDVQ